MKKPSHWMLVLTVGNVCIGSPIAIVTAALGIVMLLRDN